ncbi:MAG: leucine--tRNA ligase [Armatimonadota bacterium]|nr:MAG: leucine--tRNA ligase [Armatimonadota bacterium]
MRDSYDHQAAERKWMQRWQEAKAHEVDVGQARRPYYNLMMFPYPSAEGLHVGNVFAFTGSDVHGRFMRAQGLDVFEPMGFDAFGIHSENYALKIGVHPAQLVPRNTAAFRGQLRRMGLMLDWSHEVDTTDPGYYHWTQWLFLQLFRAGLAYQGEAPVNWCPSCKTVLADEQAEGGACERCQSVIERRQMRQWFLRITAYAQRLLDNLDWVDWSDVTKQAQRNWIGRSEGVEITFPVVDSDATITVFTTRPDTVWGATYLVLAPEHPLVARITTAAERTEVGNYVQQSTLLPTIAREELAREKTGVFTGAYALNPANGEAVPVWVADYVLMGYGTGAIMAVPAHDQRDLEFARAFGIPVRQVVSPDGREHHLAEAYVGEGVLINSGPFTGRTSIEGAKAIVEALAATGRGRRAVRFRLHDWCISRQRYWGPPIPIIHCDACGAVPVPEEGLPVVLPYVEDFAPDGSGLSPLARDEAFVHARCPSCGGPARRETDVSDNFLDSAWFFLRYPSAGLSDAPFGPAVTEKWLPVDMYIGGQEHAVLHLMYSRFVTMALKDLGYLSFEEPFRHFRAHGLLIEDGAKMSKSRGNVVNPDEYLDIWGADTLRVHLLFLGPYQEGGDFGDTDIIGARRFLERLWRYITTSEFSSDCPADPEVLNLLHSKIKKVTQDLRELRYNTAIAALMELLNGLMGQRQHHRECAQTLLKLVGPFAPFIAHELWEQVGETGLLVDQPWPQYDEALTRPQSVEIVIQIDGRTRGRQRVPMGAARADVERMALESADIGKWLHGRQIMRRVFVPNRLLNLVTRD